MEMKNPRHTILVVDDEPANLRMLERLFRGEYRVLSANCGEEALKILKQEDVSLILTDQRMPGMTGTQLLQASLFTSPYAVRIILTGYSDMDAIIEAINTTRIYRYVSKPWDPDDLKKTIEDAVAEQEKLLQQSLFIDRLNILLRAYPSLFQSADMGLDR